jgi:hypothetical protein
MDIVLKQFDKIALGFMLYALSLKRIPAKNRRDFIAYDD